MALEKRLVEQLEEPAVACTSQVLGSEFPSRPTKHSISSGSKNWYWTCLGRVKQGFLYRLSSASNCIGEVCIQVTFTVLMNADLFPLLSTLQFYEVRIKKN